MLNKDLQEDILEFVEKLFREQEKAYICLRIHKFTHMFVQEYPLKYQRDDRFIVNTEVLLGNIRYLQICSPFKFKGKYVKRYKFVRRRLSDEKKLHIQTESRSQL